MADSAPWEKYATPDASAPPPAAPDGPWAKYSPDAAPWAKYQSSGSTENVPYSAVDWKTGSQYRTPDTGPGVGTQAVYGINQGLAKYAAPIESLPRKISNALTGENEPIETPVADWLRSGQAPKGPVQRFANRAGQTVGSSVPYAALSMVGAPALSTLAEPIATEAGQLPEQVGDVSQAMGQMGKQIMAAPGAAAAGGRGLRRISRTDGSRCRSYAGQEVIGCWRRDVCLQSQ